jgi:stage V sporulation protein K
VDEPTILTGSYGPFDVGDGEYYWLRGTALGDVEVFGGGRLVNEGCIWGTVTIQDGGYLDMRGVCVEWVTEGDAVLDLQGVGRYTGEALTRLGDLPFTGPQGWGALETAWAQCVVGIDDAVRRASLDEYVSAKGKGAIDNAFRAAIAAIALTGPQDDGTLWALLSAAVFNGNPEMRLQESHSRGMWSPDDCRKKLRWPTLGKYFDAPPELFCKLLPETNRAGVSLAYDYSRAIWTLIQAVLALGETPRAAMDRAEAFHTMLVQQTAHAGRPPTSSDSSTQPRPRRGPKARKPPTKKPPTTTTRTARVDARRAKAEPDAESAGTGAPIGGPTDAKTNPADAAVAELADMVGMDNVKEYILRLRSYIATERERARHDLPTDEAINLHMVMTGNPGTGKTTVARLLGWIYKGYGLLSNGEVVELNRSQIVGQWQGHTEKAMEEQFHAALGGVLFLDEAYNLAVDDLDTFGQLLVNTLTPLLENHRGKICVVMAGYGDKMKEFLQEVNPGLEDRFTKTVHFDDYSDAELLEILQRLCTVRGYTLSAGAERLCAPMFDAARKRQGTRFGNARFVRDKVFQAALISHHHRVGPYAAKGKTSKASSRKVELQELLDVDMPADEWLSGDADESAPPPERADGPVKKTRPRTQRGAKGR